MHYLLQGHLVLSNNKEYKIITGLFGIEYDNQFNESYINILGELPSCIELLFSWQTLQPGSYSITGKIKYTYIHRSL